MNESKILAQYLANIRYENFDEETISTAKRVIFDVLTVSIGAADTKTALIWADYLDGKNNSALPKATLWNKDFPQFSYQQAAAYNGALAHMLDMDDVYAGATIHLSGVTVPTALAIGQALNLSGKKVIEAVVAGYEAGARIAAAVNPESYQFWHTTGTVGVVASAVTAGKLFGLDGEQMNHCLGNALSQAAGLWEFAEDAAMTKTLHNAHAAVAGIMVAELCKRGFTGASKGLEGNRAFLKAMTPDNHIEKILDGIGNGYCINDTSIKLYACARHVHSGICALDELMKKFDMDPEHVMCIEDRAGAAACKAVANTPLINPYKHKFSMKYCMAAYLVYGNLLDDVFHQDKIENPKVQMLMPKIQMIEDAEIDAEGKNNPEMMLHEVTVTMDDGRTFEARSEFIRGDRRNPVSWEDQMDKFLKVVGERMGIEEASTLCDNCKNMEALSNVNFLFDLKIG